LRIAEVLSPLQDLSFGTRHAFSPTLRGIYQHPRIIFNLRALSKLFFSHLWKAFADGVDGNSHQEKQKLITPHATGIVLELGAGMGHGIKYLDHEKVTQFIALEPNVLMHTSLRAEAAKHSYLESDSTLIILSLGAEDISTISIITSMLSTQHGIQHVDTLLSVLTLCSVRNPQQIIPEFVRRVLKSKGGVFLFYEHVRNVKADVSWWQSAWSPIWGLFFDGCELDRPTHEWIRDIGGWTAEGDGDGETNLWVKDGEPEDSLFWHVAGRFTRA